MRVRANWRGVAVMDNEMANVTVSNETRLGGETTQPLEEAIRFLSAQPGYVPPTQPPSGASQHSRHGPAADSGMDLVWFSVVLVCACVVALLGAGRSQPTVAASTSPWTLDALAMVAAGPAVDATNGEFMAVALPTSGPALKPDLRAGDEAFESSKANAISAATRLLGRELPQEVGIPVHGLVGSSGGLMFALAIVDLFDGEDLARGRRIAGTGRIDPSGTVSEVGRVAEKVAYAERAGAEIFVVPLSQVAEAAAAATRLRVVGVRSLAEAVEALRAR